MNTGVINDVEAVADEPLTTKEGWRRFVDRQPQPPVLLGTAGLARLSPRDPAAACISRSGTATLTDAVKPSAAVPPGVFA